jgi:hypothetical protein
MLVRRLGKSHSAFQDHKVCLGRLIREHLGEDILKQVQLEPAWTNTLDAIRERLACRTERRATADAEHRPRGRMVPSLGCGQVPNRYRADPKERSHFGSSEPGAGEVRVLFRH